MSDSEEAVDSKLQRAQVQLEEGKVTEIVQWLDSEIRRAKSDRQGLDEKILEWDRIYETIPEQENKDWPWEGASNLVVPIVPTATEAVLSRLLNSVFGGKELWVGQAKSPQWVDLAEPIGRWMNWVGSEVMDMYDVCRRWFLSTIKYGTGVLKLPWVEQFRKVKYMGNDGQMVEQRVKLHDGPSPEVVKLQDFYFSPDAISSQDIQSCEWVAQRSIRTFKYLKEMENSGVYTNVDDLKNYKRTTGEPYEEQIERRTGVEPSERNDYEIWEVWCSYDVDGDGELAELIVTFELESNTVLRAVYNFYRHQERPFHVINYMSRDNSLLGIGIAQMLEDIQTEITAIHNQRIDNATLANTKAFKRRQGSGVDIEDIYPGAVVDVVEMDDVDVLELGTEHSTLLQEEMHTNSLGEKRTGVSDYSVGRESSAIGSRATATSTMALIREGNKRFQMIIQDIREALSNVAHQSIMLYQQFAQDQQVFYELFSEEESRYVQQYLRLPPDNTRNNVHIDIPAISEAENKEVKQQTYLTLMQVTQQVYSSMIQAVGVAINPQAPKEVQQLASEGASAGSELFKRILEAFDFKDPEKFAPNIDDLLNLQSSLQEGQNQMSQLGGLESGTEIPNGQGEGPSASAGVSQLEQVMASLGAGTQGQGRGPMETPNGSEGSV